MSPLVIRPVMPLLMRPVMPLLLPLLLVTAACTRTATPATTPSTAPTSAAPRPVAQFPSPMMETTRAHERLRPSDLPGISRTFPGPAERPVALFVPHRARARDSVDVVIHFHGAAWLAQRAVNDLGDGTVSVTLNLGAGSGAYDRPFADPAVFDTLLVAIVREVSDVLGREVRLGHLTLSGFSAGHGAIRRIVRIPRLADRVDAVLLLDGMHTSYVPEGRVLADSGVLDTTNLVALTAFARRAVRGETRMLVTHSEIFPGTYASTTETADWMLASLGLLRGGALAWGPRGMQQLSEVQAGGFTLLGFAGNSAPDHVDHYHAMPELLARLHR